MYINQFYMMFTMYNRIFSNKREQVLASLNEIIILLTIYHLFCFTDFVSDGETRSLAVGNSLLGMTAINLAVNLFPIVYDLIKQACLHV